MISLARFSLPVLTVTGLVLLADFASATPPAAPSNLRFASSNANNQGTIEWDDNSTDEVNFAIEFKFGASQVISEFGSTACKALYQCQNCLEPFDYFKCL